MYFERLTLEVSATRAGWETIEPSTLRGASGVVHRFTFLASDGSARCGFDVYDEVDVIQVLRGYIKKLDTGTSVALVCLHGTPTQGAMTLAQQYGMRILGSGDIERFFSSRTIEVENVGISGSGSQRSLELG